MTKVKGWFTKGRGRNARHIPITEHKGLGSTGDLLLAPPQRPIKYLQDGFIGIRAKFPSLCKVCGEKINRGDEIAYKRGWGARHLGCQPKELTREKKSGPWTFEYEGMKLPTGFGAYMTEHKQLAPALHPAKQLQREQLTSMLPKKGTVLELYAGRGNLSKSVYSKNADKLILVDMDKDALGNARRKLEGVRHETYPLENTEFVDKHLNNGLRGELQKDLTLVDFDAFGSPADAMKSFFSKYEVKRPLYVGVTDGSFVFAQRHAHQEYGRDWVRKHYGVHMYPRNREKYVEILDKFMDGLGEKHGFKSDRVNASHGEHGAIYLGYRLTPN